MRRPIDMNKAELVVLLRRILEALYLEDDIIEPDKSWSPDTLDEIAQILDEAKLVPEKSMSPKEFFSGPGFPKLLIYELPDLTKEIRDDMTLREACIRLLVAEKDLMAQVRDNMKIDLVRIVLFGDGSGEVQADWRRIAPEREMCKEEQLLRAIFTEKGALFEFSNPVELETWLREKGGQP